MNYWLHQDALQDLSEAAEFYRETAGNPLAQAMLAEFSLSPITADVLATGGAGNRRSSRPETKGCIFGRMRCCPLRAGQAAASPLIYPRSSPLILNPLRDDATVVAGLR